MPIEVDGIGRQNKSYLNNDRCSDRLYNEVCFLINIHDNGESLFISTLLNRSYKKGAWKKYVEY